MPIFGLVPIFRITEIGPVTFFDLKPIGWRFNPSAIHQMQHYPAWGEARSIGYLPATFDPESN